MKKSFLILAAASAVAFAACNGGNNEGKLTPAQADSIANVKVDSAKAALKASNDSAMNAKANADAKTADSIRVIDSIVAATKQTMTTKTVVTRKPSSHGHHGGSTTTTTTTVEPVRDDKTNTNYRPGATNSNLNTPNGMQQQAPKSVSDRPGAH